jgi:hypothetical protein
MLWSTRDRKLRQIVRPSDDVSRRRSAGRAKPEQGLKRRHGCLSPVMAKDEFVKVDLQLMAADAVVRSDQPLLKIPDGAVGQRHCRRDRGMATIRWKMGHFYPVVADCAVRLNS